MQGPFAGYAPDERLLLAQLFVGVIGLTTLDARRGDRPSASAPRTRFEPIADTLQESLLPAALPAIPGIETAVHFRPAGERQIVGGDFYELVEGDDGSVGVAIGDALGKGAIAAADTALARYTLRAAAAAPRREPSRILGVLNDAMLRQPPDHPCTVAYARIELGRCRSAADGLDRRPSQAADPAPRRRRSSRSARPAPPLGVSARAPPDRLPRPRSQPGDALVLYTDGLTDAYAPRAGR